MGEEAAAAWLQQLREASASKETDIARLRACLKEYEDLKQSLQTLPQRVEHQRMVQLGKLAYFQGKLLHTNEVMVLLGDNYFVLRSASQAAEIAQRRAEFVEREIRRITSELEQIRGRHEHAAQLFPEMAPGSEVVEIREEFVPEEWEEDAKLGRVLGGAGGSGDGDSEAALGARPSADRSGRAVVSQGADNGRSDDNPTLSSADAVNVAPVAGLASGPTQLNDAAAPTTLSPLVLERAVDMRGPVEPGAEASLPAHKVPTSKSAGSSSTKPLSRFKASKLQERAHR